MIKLDKKVGQDVRVARSLRKGMIVELRPSQDHIGTDVYYDSAYIGYIHRPYEAPLAKIVATEKLVTTYGFEFELIHKTADQLKEDEEKLKQLSQKWQEEREQKKRNIAARKDEMLIHSRSFYTILQRCLFAIDNGAGPSLIGGFFGKSETTAQYYQRFLQGLLDSEISNSARDENLLQLSELNKRGELYPRILQHREKLMEQQRNRKPIPIYCWKCKSGTVDRNKTCFFCTWGKCTSCGACKPTCIKEGIF
ncbi:hypothetical protein [Paenibacillus woosongensis]|uniref:Uncharacterized protein n=1 Tax=Paenibacillus woosongensis TaxID=307580 RepID=A0ABQ4MTS3_9BACL|nr:hypothetical protein [Paenibacillus woosongensis]GIP59325.1 hypothetical protein J15TS10_31390 [Paenibacillus woosongensis]